MRFAVAISPRLEFAGVIVSVEFAGCVLFDFLQVWALRRNPAVGVLGVED